MAANKTKRQPVSQGHRHKFLTHRDAIWAAIRELREEFTINDLESKTRASKDTIKNYLTGLMIAGYVQRLDRLHHAQTPGAARITTAFTCYLYNLIKDVGVDAPRVKRDGSPVTQGLARENMWRTMRIIKQFNIRHLVVHASTEETQVKESDAKDYLKYLKAAGYVRIIQKRAPGRSTVYLFIDAMYSGPKPPMVQKVGQVFDPNTREVVWTEGQS